MAPFFDHLHRTKQIDEKLLDSLTRSLVQKLRRWIRIIRLRLSYCTSDEQRRSIVEDGHQFIRLMSHLFEEIKRISNEILDERDEEKLKKLNDDLLRALQRSLDIDPSIKCFDQAMKQMSEYVYRLAGPFEQNRSISSLINTENLNHAADQLNRATNDLVISTRQGEINNLARSSVRFSQAFGDFLDHGLDFIHRQDEEEKRSHLLISLKNVHTTSNQLLERAKSASAEPFQSENVQKKQLADAARFYSLNIHKKRRKCFSFQSRFRHDSKCDQQLFNNNEIIGRSNSMRSRHSRNGIVESFT